MEEIRNPFSELHGLMELARKKPPSAMALDVWASVFECEADDLDAIVSGFSRTMNLLNETREAVKRFVPGENSIFITPLDTIQKGIKSQHLNKNWDSNRGFITNALMTELSFGKYAMVQHYPGSSPESDQSIRNFIDKLDALLAECLDSNLTIELKRFFTSQLETLRSALIAYRVDGPEGLEQALDKIIGALHRKSGPIKAEPVESKEFIGRFFDVLGKVNDMVSGYQNAATIALPTASALLLPLLG